MKSGCHANCIAYFHLVQAEYRFNYFNNFLAFVINPRNISALWRNVFRFFCNFLINRILLSYHMMTQDDR